MMILIFSQYGTNAGDNEQPFSKHIPQKVDRKLIWKNNLKHVLQASKFDKCQVKLKVNELFVTIF